MARLPTTGPKRMAATRLDTISIARLDDLAAAMHSNRAGALRYLVEEALDRSLDRNFGGR